MILLTTYDILSMCWWWTVMKRWWVGHLGKKYKMFSLEAFSNCLGSTQCCHLFYLAIYYVFCATMYDGNEPIVFALMKVIQVGHASMQDVGDCWCSRKDMLQTMYLFCRLKGW